MMNDRRQFGSILNLESCQAVEFSIMKSISNQLYDLRVFQSATTIKIFNFFRELPRTTNSLCPSVTSPYDLHSKCHHQTLVSSFNSQLNHPNAMQLDILNQLYAVYDPLNH